MHSFDQIIERRNTGSLKWDKYTNPQVLPLWVADMDFVADGSILQALQDRIEHGILGYTVPYPAVVDAVVEYQARVHDYTIHPQWLVWTHGLVPALNIICAAYGEPGDSVLTCTPVYPPFLSAPVNQQRELITSKLVLEEGRWTFDWEDLEAKVTKRSRVFILCSPHNPVGRVFNRQELERLGEFCIRHDLILCSDEIHCDLLLDDRKHIVSASLSKELEQRTLTLMSPSKTYNLPGLSCAYAIIANPELRQQFQRAARGLVTEVNTLGYVGCQAAYQQAGDWHQQLLAYLTANRDYLYAFIEEHIAEITLQPMEATYLAWLNVSRLKQRGVADPRAFFEAAGVGLSPGSDFGDADYLRLNFGCPKVTLEEALQRMARAVASLK